MLNFAAGSTSISLDVQIVDDAGLPVAGLLAATFPTLVYSVGTGADVAFPSLSDLSLLTSSFSAGGVKERDGGYYRLDVPDAIFADAGIVTIRGEATDKRLITPRLQVGPLATSAPSAIAIREEIDANSTKLDATISSRLASSSYTNPPTAGAIRTELDNNSTKLANLDATITSRMASGTVQLAASQPNYSPAKAGDAMTLTTGERTAVANAVESEIIDDTDSEKVLQAIVDKIAAANPSLEDLTLGAIASAIRTELATELGRIDANITSRSNYDGSDTAGTTTLLARLTNTRAGNLDNLNSPVADLASAVGTLATVLNGIKGEGWTNETLKAIFEKDVEATIGEEQIESISGEISQALADQGITVAEFAAEALAQLAATKSISLVSPFLPSGDLQIQIGDDYLAADGTALDWTNTAGSWGDLTDCEIEFRSSRVVNVAEEVNEVLAGIVVNPTGSTQKIRVEIPSAWTLTLSPTKYAFQVVRINPAGHVLTLRRGNLLAHRRVGVSL